MNDIYQQILEKIEEIEQEMKRIGFWDEKNFEKNINTPTFEQYLQYGVIPKVRKIVAEKGGFPKESNLGLRAMKEYDYMDSVPEADNLQRLLREFDNIINK
jgi:uncharacterized protein YqcC (DUF446 family)